ncbi:hypothetical protein ENUP19_0041G0109 [Entamoeba nuttalli]|uniref:Protein kinase domain-containing protein n=1 Tax=Entamoeba nuttalli TaxID=412467 RepID=A0ABQ0DA69_9EUKA
MDIPKTYIPSSNINIYYNSIDHCYYYFSKISFFSKDRYDRIDSISTPAHHVYLVSTQPTPVIRYSLPSTPISLASFFKSSQMTESILISIVRQIIESLSILHSNGVYHGNLSADTIFINPESYEIAFIDFLFPRTTIMTDPVIPSLHREVPFNGISSFFQKDILSIPSLLLIPFSIPSVHEFLSNTSSSLSRCSPLLDQLLRSYLSSPFPFQTSLNFFKALPENIKYLLDTFPSLVLSSYLTVKYGTSSQTDYHFILTSSIPSLIHPCLPPSLMKTKYITQLQGECFLSQPSYPSSTFYADQNELYFQFPRKKIYSTALAQLVFLLLEPSNDNLSYFNFSCVDLSYFLDQPIERSLNYKPLRIPTNPLLRYSSQLPFRTPLTLQKRAQFHSSNQKIILVPQISVRTNSSLLLYISSKLRSFGMAVQCKKSIEEICDTSNSKIVIVDTFNKEIRGFVVDPSVSGNEILELIHKKVGLRTCLETIINNCHLSDKKGYSSFMSFKELDQLLNPKFSMMHTIGSARWCASIYSITKKLTSKASSLPANQNKIHALTTEFKNGFKNFRLISALSSSTTKQPPK